MNRIFPLVLIVTMILLSNVSYAADWCWIYSDDKYGIFFDAESVKYGYNRNNNEVLYWQKTVYTQEGANIEATRCNDDRFYDLGYSISQNKIHFNSRTIEIFSVVYYDTFGNVISTDNSYESTVIYPDSIGDVIYRCIKNYCRA